MPTFTQIYYHIVFSTKNRQPVLIADQRPALFKYIWGIIQNKDGHLYRINGVEDHLHIFTSLRPSLCLADLIKDIKIATSQWIKQQHLFPLFTHWQDGYGAFSVSHAERNSVIEYIRQQEEHHKKYSFQDELKTLLIEAGVDFDERYLS